VETRSTPASNAALETKRPLEVRLLNGAVRTFNRLGGALCRTGLPIGRFGLDGLKAKALRATGLHDFGDHPLDVPLQILLDAFESEARLNMVGRLSVRWDALRLLKNRLLLQEDRRQNPEIARETVKGPIFILGLPRSGTTHLHNLLSQDPALRCPAHWETMYPSPPPGNSPGENDPRIRTAQGDLKWMYRLAPEFKAIHPMDARLPEQCTEITAHVFMSFRFSTHYEIPSYLAWLDKTGQRDAFAYHKQFLQHLQWNRPALPWVLKAPEHVFVLEDLFDAYPDARVVMTHRDPLKVVPSEVSLTTVLRRIFSDRVDPKGVGRSISAHWAEGARRMVRAREGDQTPGRFLDVHYPDLLKRPMEVVQRIYSAFGLPMSADARTRMEHFLGRNPQGRFGRHRYSRKQFGLDAAELEDRFSEYVRRFQIEPESR